MHRFAWLLVALSSMVSVCLAADRGDDLASLEQQFRTLPLEARRLARPAVLAARRREPPTAGDLRGQGCRGGQRLFHHRIAAARRLAGEGWWRDLGICLEAAKRNGLQMWIFDEKWWPSQGVGGKVPAALCGQASGGDGRRGRGAKSWSADGYAGPRYVAAVAGRVAADGRIEAESLVDLAPFIATASSPGRSRPAGGRS